MRTTNQSDCKQSQTERIPEARYSYYRRCQLFRRNGEQCKAPAEKGAYICYAHAGQLATAVRRERERRAVLAEAVAEMHRRGKPECEMAELFTDFKGIQVTLAVTAQALINGRIDCKTAGRMVVHLQTCSKLLWQIHRKGGKGLPLINTADTDRKRTAEEPSLTTEARRHREERGLQQICAEERRSNKAENLPEQKRELLTTEGAKEHEGQAGLTIAKKCGQSGSANRTRSADIIVIRRTRGADARAERVHGPPDVVRAA